MIKLYLRVIKSVRRLLSTRYSSDRTTLQRYDGSQTIAQAGKKKVESLLPFDDSTCTAAEVIYFADVSPIFAGLDPKIIDAHPHRGTLALLLSIFYVNNGDLVKAKELMVLASKWGCERRLMSEALIAISLDTTARAALLARQCKTAERQFDEANVLTRSFIERLSEIDPVLAQRAKETSLLKQSRVSDNSSVTRINRRDSQIQEESDAATSAIPELFDLNSALLPHQISVLDIGANPIDGDPPYRPLLELMICNVSGFEPNLQALAKLNSAKTASEQYFPYAIGDGKRNTVNFYEASGMTSLFEIDEKKLELFDFFKPLCKLKNRVEFDTRRIDDLEEIDYIDYLKIDIQGGELAALKSGEQKLRNVVLIQTEVSFVSLYKDQPTFGEIDIYLRSLDFMPHCFTSIKRWPISPYRRSNSPKKPIHQLLEADIVYIKDISKIDQFSSRQLKSLALISHYCYDSHDLALKCLTSLEERREVDKIIVEAYRTSISSD